MTGEGTAFCSGADLHTVGDAGFLDALYAMLQRVVEVPVPVVAAVNGPAIGAGTQLAIAADLRVVDPGAVFGLPTAGLGLAVDPWTVRRLALLAGGGPARRMLLACERLDVTAAAGLVDRLGTPDDALAWAAEMAELAPLTLAYNKLAVNRLLEDATDPETLDEVGPRSPRAGRATTSSRDAAPARRSGRRASSGRNVFRGGRPGGVGDMTGTEQETGTQLQAGLRDRHVTMISIAGVIGAGLFVGSGTAINQAGPAVLISYAFAGLLVVLVMRMLGEMAAANPDTGSFSTYADRAIGPWAGFTVGWLYWWFWVLVIPVEATAAATILESLDGRPAVGVGAAW